MDSFKIIRFEELNSTNAKLKELAERGAENGKVVTACGQTEGRGRKDRRFYSPKGSGLYLSILVRPTFDASFLGLLTPMTAVVVARAVERISERRAMVKWVNDVYVDEKKACGILTESKFGADGNPLYAVVGIGVNVYTPKEGFPAEIADRTTALFAENSGDKVEILLKAILEEFKNSLNGIEQKAFLREYRERSILTGRKILVNDDVSPYYAEVIGIDDDCGLIVRSENGKTSHLKTGEVSIIL